MASERCLLAAGILAAWADVCPCPGDRLDLRQGDGFVRRRAAGRDRDRDRAGAPAAARRDHERERHVPVPERADRHLHRHASSSPASRRRRGPNVVITTGFNAGVDQKLEIGQMSEEVTISAASPVVDTKKTTTGATFTADVLEKIPTARDPWQIINMTPGRAGRPQRRRLGLGPAGRPQRRAAPAPTCSGTSKAGRSPTCRRTPRRRTSTSTRSSEIQVINGGGDVSVQSRGLSINLVTKSGSNVFKGSAVGTFENDAMQAQQRHARSCSTPGAERLPLGQPDQEDQRVLGRVRRPDHEEQAVVLGRGRQAGHQRRRRSTSSTPSGGELCADLVAAQQAASARSGRS